MIPSMQHHRTTRKKSFVHGLAPSEDLFPIPNWTPVDRAIRRARWQRLRSERASRSGVRQVLGLVGAILVLVLGISASIGPTWHPLEQAQATQQAAFFAQEAERAEAAAAAAPVRANADTTIPGA
ncbi:hypothetical protein [Longibacter sp.]|uniref:hypothetical protein n=1 Tax=Longibacter sp. TaxID=2045415 RepID=UPI003EC01AB7